MSASGALSVIPTKEDLIAKHNEQNKLASSSSININNDENSITADTSACNNNEEKETFSKCEIDPVKAQDDAMISVALKIRDGKMSVNEFAVDDARTTMVRSNYAPDWTAAHWDHPLLSNLKNLSCLSSFDLPSHTKRGLVDERKAIKYSEERRREEHEHQLVEATNSEEENQQETGQEETNHSCSRKHTQPNEVRDEVIEKEALEYAITHKTPAVVETSPFILNQKALLDLSPETIANDPQLLALISAVAKANKHDPRIAGKVAMGETPTIPVEVMTPSIKNTYPVHRKATDALPRPTLGNYNKGFHDSDIVAYSKIKEELSPEKVKKIAAAAAAHDDNDNTSPEERGEDSQQQEIEESSSSSTKKKSMHDVGYKTWMQKHLDQPAEFEDREKFAEYRDQVTSLEGKCLSVSEKKGGASAQ